MVVMAVTGCVHAPPRPVDFRLQRFSSAEFYEAPQDRGSVVLIDGWAAWCGLGKRSMPKLVRLAARHADRGLKFVTINTDDDTLKINRFLADAQVNPPVLLDERGAQTRALFDIEALPTTLVLDRKGLVRFRHRGLTDEIEAQVEVEVQQLLEEP